jgi:hypothetical protein
MSNELSVVNSDQSMLEAMGMANLTGGSGLYVPRVSLLQEAIMGTMEVNGKQIKTEVVPAGAFRINPDKDTPIYAENVKMRIFTIRQQFSRYDAENNRTYKSVQAQDLRGDLKDELGGFNLGKPSGYVKDYNSLTKEQQAVRNAKIYYGVVTLVDPVDDKGEALEGYDEPMPFVMDVTSAFSRRAMDDALKAILRKNVLPINYELDVTHTSELNKAGKEIRFVQITGGNAVDADPRDQETFEMFQDRIEGINKYVLSKWDEANSNDPQMSDEDIDLVNAFVDVEEAD